MSVSVRMRVISQYIFKTQQENISYAEMICGKKLNLKMDINLILQFLDAYE